METQFTWYVLGALGVVAVAARLSAAGEQPPLSTTAGRRAAVLTLAILIAGVAIIARVPPIAALAGAALPPDSLWLVADTLWLVAGFLALLWVDPAVQAAGGDETPQWDPLRALWHVRTFLIVFVAAALWVAAWQHPEAWGALQRGTPAHAGFGPLPLAYMLYQGYLFALVVFFVQILWRLRTLADTRIAYLRLSITLFAAAIYLISPALQAATLVVLWLSPHAGTWPVFLPAVQIAQIVGGSLTLPELVPPHLAEILFAPIRRRDRRDALAQLERFHAWLAARRPELVLPESGRPDRAGHLLIEIERAARYALSYAPARTRARLAELGEHRVYIAGRYGQSAEPTAALIVEALRDWSVDRMPADLPRFRFTGDDDARLVFWGWVAAGAIA